MCNDCDIVFPCYENKQRCIRLPPSDYQDILATEDCVLDAFQKIDFHFEKKAE